MRHPSNLGDDSPLMFRLGIPQLDNQHADLYRLVLELSAFPSDPITSLRCAKLLHAIWKSSFDHFRDEEDLMRTGGMFGDKYGRHAEDHALHLNYVTRLWTHDFPDCRIAPTAGEVYRKIGEFWSGHIVQYDLDLADHLILAATSA